MEKIDREKKPSFFSRVINRIKAFLKRSALFDIIFNSDAGRVWTEKDTEAFVPKSIRDAFENAGENIGDLLSTPKTSKASKDPFGRLDPNSLVTPTTPTIPLTREKHSVVTRKGRERAD